jgi:hypothetical protein
LVLAVLALRGQVFPTMDQILFLVLLHLLAVVAVEFLAVAQAVMVQLVVLAVAVAQLMAELET